MKHILFLVLIVSVASSVTLQAAESVSSAAERHKRAYEAGYRLGYTTGRGDGHEEGRADRNAGVADSQQNTTLSEGLLDIEMQRAPSGSALAPVYPNAEHEFIRGYRLGFGAGWTDGYQVGYATPPAAPRFVRVEI